MSDRLPPLSFTALVAGIPVAAVVTLLDGWLPAKVPAGRIIHTGRDRGQMLYIVRSGRLVASDENGSRTLGPGAILGHMPDYGFSLTGTTVTATEPTHLLVLSRVIVEQLRQNFPSIGSRLRPLEP